MELVTDDRCPSPMALLRRGVPLSLLLDLAYGPDSEHVLATEPPRRPVVRGGAAVAEPGRSRPPTRGGCATTR